MTFDELKNNIPEFAKDVKLNFSSLIKNSEFNDDLVYGCAYASALALGDKMLSNIFEQECEKRFGIGFVESVKSTVVIMTLNNTWYKYRDSMPNSEMKMAPQRMRVNVMANHAGLDKILFESLSLCISAINGCMFCIKAHSDLLIKNDKTNDFVFNIGRIASVISALSKAVSLK
tara:strand:+ start:624 stop:1145 length:522 start_codon:yes stop_codon:yes gene_type:complete